MPIDERREQDEKVLEALARAGVGTRRGKTGEDLVLQRACIGVDQRRRQLALVGVAAIQRALPDTGRASDLLHRDGVDALGREQPRRRVEDARAITSGVSAFVHDLRVQIEERGRRPCGRRLPVQLASQALTLLGLAAIHFFAASSGFMFLPAISTATEF